MNLSKNMFPIEKNKILDLLWIKKVLNKIIDYFMYYPSRRQMKRLQLQVYIQNNDFMKNKKLTLSKC